MVDKISKPWLLGVGMAHKLHGCLHSLYGWLWLIDFMAAHSGSRLRLRGLVYLLCRLYQLQAKIGPRGAGLDHTSSVSSQLNSAEITLNSD